MAWGLGFGVQDLRFRVKRLGFTFSEFYDSGFRVKG
jgi:hypothetical protein